VINAAVEISEVATTRRVRVTAPSIRRALLLAGEDRPGVEVRVLFPIDAIGFFAPAGVPEAFGPVLRAEDVPA
jgi:hypothetical protein